MITNVKVEPVNTISDHMTVYFEIHIKITPTREKILRYRNKNELSSINFSETLAENYNLFRTQGCIHGMNETLKCVKCLCDFYNHSAATYFDEKAPIIEKKIIIRNNEQKKWYNNDIRRAKSEMRRAERKLYRSHTEENKTEYARCRLAKQTLIVDVKKRYYSEKIQACGNDYRNLYRTLNELTGKDIACHKLPTLHNKLPTLALPEIFKFSTS